MVLHHCPNEEAGFIICMLGLEKALSILVIYQVSMRYFEIKECSSGMTDLLICVF